MYAMILAAGHGKRMMPLTENLPKPLLKVGTKTLIEHQIDRLADAGIRDFVVNCGRFGEKIIDHLTQNCEQDHNFYFSDEGSEVLETGGGIAKALPLIKSDPFIVVNADVWTSFDYRTLIGREFDLMHLVLVKNPEHNLKGDFALDKSNKINLLEPKYTFSGIGLYRKEVFKNLEIKPFPLVDIIKRHSKDHHVSGELFEGVWSDIGTPERLKNIQESWDRSAK